MEEPKIEYFSVGGTSSDRIRRQQVLASFSSNRGYALANSPYDSCPGGFFVPNCLPEVSSEDTSDKFEDIVCTPQWTRATTLCVIGHCSSKEVLETLPLCGSEDEESLDIECLVQGPGFNLNAGCIARLDASPHISSVTTVSASQCPRWSAKEWSELLSLYPDPLRVLRVPQLVTFYLTRQQSMVKIRRQEDGTEVMTSAFYNQFGIIPDSIQRVLEFERTVVYSFFESASQDMYLAVRAWCRLILTGLKMIEAEANTVEEALKEVANMMTSIPLEAPFHIHLVRPITEALEKFSHGIKEYDSYALHTFVANKHGLAPPSGSQHYHLMLNILKSRRHQTVEWTSYESHLRSVVQKHSSRSHHWIVLHDLGLDPQNDDYLAILLLEWLLQNSDVRP